MRKAKKAQAKGKKGKSPRAKSSSMGLRRVRRKANKQSAARLRRDVQMSAYPLSGGKRSSPEPRLAHGDTFMRSRVSDTARMSSETMLVLYRISRRY